MAPISAKRNEGNGTPPPPVTIPFHVSLEGATGEPLAVELVPEKQPAFKLAGEVLRPKVARVERGRYEVELEGRLWRVEVEGRNVVVDGTPLPLAVRKAPPSLGGRGAAGRAGSGRIEVKPPMPGRIVDVKVTKGQRVSRGDVLVVLEAMKMQNEIMAPADGTVTEVGVTAGENIDARRILAVIEPGGQKA